MLNIFLILFFCVVKGLKPYEWHYFDLIQKSLLYEPNCMEINQENYVNVCKKYNQRATPVSILDLDHWNALEQLLTENASSTNNKCTYDTLNHGFYGLGGSINNQTGLFYWWNNEIFNKYLFNNLNMNNITYIGISFPFTHSSNNIQINGFNYGIFGFICQLNSNNIIIMETSNNQNEYVLLTKIIGFLVFIFAITIIILLICLKYNIQNYKLFKEELHKYKLNSLSNNAINVKSPCIKGIFFLF